MSKCLEMAKDYILENTNFEIMGGYYSPVSDHYYKEGLAPSHHRVRMCELAVERTSQWLMVDAWESLKGEYTRTALVMDHFNEELNERRGGVKASDGRFLLTFLFLSLLIHLSIHSYFFFHFRIRRQDTKS